MGEKKDGVRIEGHLAHHVTRGRVPGIVLPECEQASGAKSIEHEAHCFGAIGADPGVIVVSGDSAFDSLEDLVAALRADLLEGLAFRDIVAHPVCDLASWGSLALRLRQP